VTCERKSTQTTSPVGKRFGAGVDSTAAGDRANAEGGCYTVSRAARSLRPTSPPRRVALLLIQTQHHQLLSLDDKDFQRWIHQAVWALNSLSDAPNFSYRAFNATGPFNTVYFFNLLNAVVHIL